MGDSHLEDIAAELQKATRLKQGEIISCFGNQDTQEMWHCCGGVRMPYFLHKVSKKIQICVLFLTMPGEGEEYQSNSDKRP
jgi:hypothetical protein